MRTPPENGRNHQLASIVRGFLGATFLFSSFNIVTASAMPNTGNSMKCDISVSMIEAIISPNKSLAEISVTPPDQPLDIQMDPHGDPISIKITGDSPLWKKMWTGITPPHDLVLRWLTLPDRGVSNCLNARQIHEINNRGNAGHDRQSISLSAGLPAIDHTGSKVLLLITEKASGLSGTTKLLYLTKTSNAWHVAGERVVSVS